MIPDINLIIPFFLCLIQSSRQTKEVVLLDTREARDYLNWEKKTNDLDDETNSNRGWSEMSWNAGMFRLILSSSPQILNPQSQSSTVWRTQYVCDITSDKKVDNWLRTPYFKREQAKRIEIELGFSVRDCSSFSNPNEIRSCRETFELYIYETDDINNNWNVQSYKLIDIIAGNRFTSSNHGGSLSSDINNNNNDHKDVVNVKSRGIAINKKGFYIAFRDQGACISLLYVKIYYRLCEEKIISLIRFPETATGAHLTDIEQRDGLCIDNTKMIYKPIGMCKGNGEWAFQESSLRESCLCHDGYEFEYISGECKACAAGKFKNSIGNELCHKCPLNSHTMNNGSSYCNCDDGFFRINASLFTSPCIGSPIEPQNLTVEEIDQASVKISWKRTVNDLSDIIYRIECNRIVDGRSIPCESHVNYYPNRTFLNGTNVWLTGLDADTSYHIEVFSEQWSTRLTSKTVDISFTTKRPIPKSIRDIAVYRLNLNTILLTWAKSDFDLYELRYWIDSDFSNNNNNNNEKTLITVKDNNFTLTTTLLNINYTFQIRGRTRIGWGPYTHPKTITIDSIDTLTSSQTALAAAATRFVENKNLIVGGPIIILILLIVVIMLAIIYIRRKRSCRLKTASDCESLDYQKRQGAAPLWNPTAASSKTYIDPHTYEDPTKAVKDFARELDPNLIVIEAVIGGGEFGDVCRGKLRKPNSRDVTVAIKTLKQGATEKTRLDFLSEASIMGQFDDENVIYLEGVVTKHHPIMIVTEYMENGSLDTFLRLNEGKAKLDALQLTRMLRGISSGMKYLSDMRYVHRDLAARNILVNKDLVCKVADFGLSREVDGDTYTTRGGKIPVRWTAIEAIDYRKFTSNSDVWSYGVLCWEMISFGERPFWDWSNQDVIKAIKKGYRLPPPMGCPDALYKLMLDCWKDDYLDRPKFEQIVIILSNLIQTPTKLLILAKQTFVFIVNPDQPNFAQITSIDEWLHSLQLDHCIKQFKSSGYMNLSQICHFTQRDLIDIGLTINFDQHKILDALKKARSNLELTIGKTSEGYLV
ncbi:unnamed protein product [Didymodactylos carnosus]|uniref:receptor protein-tyrosine kinase n=1 Tax=Didymodactylos carnosus TaxID=1234261 RepID=A0A814GD20_9BILA|nr:unnamed protein product [Didymodactylos carnosus]CAF0993404.1 unnamed protein product [Didymodactylos carnosus]CAF3658914.1 unnamed protein product [Didymodactylos carnosus]CAF3765236.1 unnamed protein product [Didymodactylos carnosus]